MIERIVDAGESRGTRVSLDRLGQHHAAPHRQHSDYKTRTYVEKRSSKVSGLYEFIGLPGEGGEGREAPEKSDCYEENSCVRPGA